MAPLLRRTSPLLLLALLGCAPEYEPAPQSRVLTTDPLLDAGAVAVGDRLTLGLELRSQGAAPVTVKDIVIEHEGDAEPFVLLDWAEASGDLELARGTEAAPTVAIVQVSYRPEQAGSHRALLSISSTDTQVEDGTWRVALRGLALEPCATIHPTAIDFGPRSGGSYTTQTAELVNCGPVDLTVSGFELGGSSTYSVLTADPLYVAPGESQPVELAWVPAADTAPDHATLTLLHNAPRTTLAVSLRGNACEGSVDPRWDGDGDGWFLCGGDCDDGDPEINPSAVELSNGQDDDCDGLVDEPPNATDSDEDGDGYTELEGDCDDADPEINPGAPEVLDAVDNDCSGLTDDNTSAYDDDGDGFSEDQGDCDDEDDLVHPGAQESLGTLDEDCDGQVDEGSDSFDDDGDGYAEREGDCDDDDPWAHPSASEDCDEVDNDCDGEVDEGEACAYLAERSVDTGLGEPRGCSSVPGGRGAGLLLAMLGLLGICRRDLPWPMLGGKG
jgi:hypothetical protein